ncbi:ferrochelatase [Oceanicola granulosus HTCC2516]|uniref:Ferrochelatase n=1 Tax=Oceanicola granulosus (strain ATCC BAA-861 / DSM 15982 / KCTC 12143 / HTCC2516) TaxID=314256 RepID=Q2CJR5_OCEGH|nr:hypothetical protein [Oceanicola granulosus]EAR53074.1 ferrochelatase [Oceanicola granulosus HTCC2516]
MTRLSLAAALALAATTAQADGPADPIVLVPDAPPPLTIEEANRGSSFPAETLVLLAFLGIIAVAVSPE